MSNEFFFQISHYRVKPKSMKFAPEGHDYNGFTQYFFEGKELEFLEILLSGKDKHIAAVKANTWIANSAQIVSVWPKVTCID